MIREGARPDGLVRLWLALLNSLRGIANCYRSEAAFRQEVWASILVVPLAFYFGKTGVERVLLIGSYVVLLIVELLNTGIEVVVDRIGLERHALSGGAAGPAAGGDHLVTRAIRLTRVRPHASTQTVRR